MKTYWHVTAVDNFVKIQNEGLKLNKGQIFLSDLLKEYFKAIGQKSFIETLPGKILRFTICSGLGIAAGYALPIVEASITGLCLNACDSFLLDKLTTGWKPNQYIEGDVQRLLTTAI